MTLTGESTVDLGVALVCEALTSDKLSAYAVQAQSIHH